MKLGTPSLIKIEALKEKTQVRFLLSFSASSPPVEFETTARGAMLLMQGLQAFQAHHKIPIPRRVLSSGWKPKLHVVKTDD
jgi:hypothetical protein